MSWCWWCCHDFKGTSLTMPLKYDDRRKTFTTSGRFCSWSCMKSYALDTKGLTQGSIVCGNMIIMRKKLFGKFVSIKPAPPRQSLIEFGGMMSIDEFRENNSVDTEERIEEITCEPEPNIVVPAITNNAKMYEIKGAMGTNEPLRLKRAKPLKRDQNNLESVLGLIVKSKS